MTEETHKSILSQNQGSKRLSGKLKKIVLEDSGRVGRE